MPDKNEHDELVALLNTHSIRFESDGNFGERSWIQCECDLVIESVADHTAHVAAMIAAAGFTRNTEWEYGMRDRDGYVWPHFTDQPTDRRHPAHPAGPWVPVNQEGTV